MEKCSTFFVYVDHLVKLETPLRHWDIADNLELTLDTLTNNNLFLIVAIGDFNAKTANWYKNDIQHLTKA